MFDDLNKNVQGGQEGNFQGPKPVEDIFSNTDAAKNAKPAVFQPKAEAAEQFAIEDERPGLDKRYFVLGALILGLITVGAGGVYFYKNFAVKTATVQTPEEQDKNMEPVIGNKNTGNAAVNTNVIPDQDHDGLSDEEEKGLGMDSNNIDSDDDGLFDREEVRVYKTNPLKPDTDGDGFLDGNEVKSGYNPNGAGKLFEIK